MQCDAIRYVAHRSTGFAARFQPIDRGNRELGGHGKAQTLAGDWAVQARSPAGSLVGRVLWRPARRNARERAVYVRVGDGTVCCGRRRQTSNFQRLDSRDPGDSRQCFNAGARLSSHVLSARPSVRPSAAVVVVVVGATGHVTDGAQHAQQSTYLVPEVAPRARPDQSSDSSAAAGSFLPSAAGESSSLASPVGLHRPRPSPHPNWWCVVRVA